MENKSKIEEAAAMLNIAIVQRRAMTKSLQAIVEQIDIIDVIAIDDNSVQLHEGLEILAAYYGVEIEKTPNYAHNDYERYCFAVDGIEYFELKHKAESLPEEIEEEVNQGKEILI